MAVVGREREAAAPGLEELVPVHRRQAAADLELAAGVEDLDARDGLRQLERAGRDAGPVRVGEVGDAAVCRDPGRRPGEVEPLALEALERVVDPEREDVAVAAAGQQAVELGARQHEQALGRRRVAPDPVVGDGEHVVPGALVVLDERAGRELAVGVRRVGVERAAKPGSRCLPGICSCAGAP